MTRKINDNHPHSVDVHVGQRLRQRRTLLGMTQTELADIMGVTFQQIQKYEKGSNRISASRLYEMSEALKVKISYFFDEMPLEISKKPEKQTDVVIIGSGESDNSGDIFLRKKSIELIRHFYQIPDKDIRDRVFGLVKSMADDYTEKLDKQQKANTKH